MLIFALAAAAAAQQPARDACLDRIVDYAGWRPAPNQQWDFRAPGLMLMGAGHERDPGHEQFPRIAAAFREAAPTVAFFEGPDRGIADTAEETIRTRGESGYVRFLAHQAGIPAQGLEPNPGQQIAALQRQFPIDQVMLFFVLRETARLRDRENLSGGALDAAVARLLERIGPRTQSANITLPFTDIAGLQAAAARYWPNRDWRSFPANWFDPLGDDSRTGGIFLAAVNRADSNNRNRHMAALLIDAVRSGRRVFALVGGNHVPMQAPALACALGERG